MWNFNGSPYYQLRVNNGGFHGLVCLLKLKSGNKKIDGGNYQYWETPLAGKAAICGSGMTWMQLVPDGKMSLCYIDIIEKIDFDPDGVAVFIDKYLDVEFTPQGDVIICDRDELDAAFESGELSESQYAAAIEECDCVIAEYCSDIPKTVAGFDALLVHADERIKNGEGRLKPTSPII